MREKCYRSLNYFSGNNNYPPPPSTCQTHLNLYGYYSLSVIVYYPVPWLHLINPWVGIWPKLNKSLFSENLEDVSKIPACFSHLLENKWWIPEKWTQKPPAITTRKQKSSLQYKRRKQINVRREAKTSKKMSVAIYIPVLIIPQAGTCCSTSGQSGSGFYYWIKRSLSNVEEERDWLKRSKSNAQEWERTLKYQRIALQNKVSWVGLTSNSK